jgi:hypothetical protein
MSSNRNALKLQLNGPFASGAGEQAFMHSHAAGIVKFAYSAHLMSRACMIEKESVNALKRLHKGGYLAV